ncbi:hypothetical protein ABIC63_002817 [Pseudacidovorax sp. 1753]
MCLRCASGRRRPPRRISRQTCNLNSSECWRPVELAVVNLLLVKVQPAYQSLQLSVVQPKGGTPSSSRKF